MNYQLIWTWTSEKSNFLFQHEGDRSALCGNDPPPHLNPPPPPHTPAHLLHRFHVPARSEPGKNQHVDWLHQRWRPPLKTRLDKQTAALCPRSLTSEVSSRPDLKKKERGPVHAPVAQATVQSSATMCANTRTDFHVRRRAAQTHRRESPSISRSGSRVHNANPHPPPPPTGKGGERCVIYDGTHSRRGPGERAAASRRPADERRM